MYTKLGEHQNVEVTRSTETRPSSETERFLTNPNSVIGSSSSGSVTVDSARRTLSLRSAWASWAIIHLERRSTTARGAFPSSRLRQLGSSGAKGGASSWAPHSSGPLFV